MDRASPTDIMLMKKEQKDAELDKKIEALRKKNEALMKRYREVEEDRKQAEQEGMALQSRKGKSEDLTITINNSHSEARVVMKKTGASGVSLSPRGVLAAGDGPAAGFGGGQGKRRQLLVTMAGSKGKRVVSERPERTCAPSSHKHPAVEEEIRESAGRGRQPQITKRVSPQDKRSVAEERSDVPDCDADAHLQHAVGPAHASPEEQEEYLRWKMEREEIDRERVARHKNAKGQWRRAWDMDKTDLMFSEKAHGEMSRGTQDRGGRNARRGQTKCPTEQGHRIRHRDKRGKNLPVVSSKAKGKDRLTGRARRWDTKEEGEQEQAAETSLEEFLEELDALCDPEADDLTPETESQEAVPKTVVDSSEEPGKAKETAVTLELDGSKVSGPVAIGTAGTESSSPKGHEKRVRFSEVLIQGVTEKTCSDDSADPKLGSIKGSVQLQPLNKDMELKQSSEDYQVEELNKQGKGVTEVPQTNDLTGNSSPGQDEMTAELPEVLELSEASRTETTESSLEKTPDQSSSFPNGEEASVPAEHSVEHTKNSASRSSDELIDSGLSVLSLESEHTIPDLNTSTEKARENGKIV